MAPHMGRGESGQAAGYPPPDRLARKPSLEAVAELASEDDVDGLAGHQNASKVSNSHGQVRSNRCTRFGSDKQEHRAMIGVRLRVE